MYGMWQYAVQMILLDVGEGECWGEDCDYSGSVEARLDPLAGDAEYECPRCGATNRRDIPEDF